MPHWYWLITLVVFGACVGSFLNVVIFRLPAGMSLVHPPSHDPATGRKLAWFENVPLLSWLVLRGRARHTGEPISVQYPLVEAITAVLFGWVFYNAVQHPLTPAGPGALWAEAWPLIGVELLLVACLVAATRIDARLYIIPLQIPWLLTLLAVVLIPPIAAVFPAVAEPIVTHSPWIPQSDWTLAPVAVGGWWGGAVGGCVGVAASIALLRFGVLPLSFAMPIERVEAEGAEEAEGPADLHPRLPAAVEFGYQQPKAAAVKPRAVVAGLVAVGVAIALAWWGGLWGQAGAVALLWYVALLLPLEDAPAEEDPDHWEEFADPRKEVLKEVLFLLPPLFGFIIGYGLGGPGADAPAWQLTLGGVLLGYLVGGFVIWAIRILGTLGFGREAMGLGDVHLLAAIGAVLGPWEAVLIPFLAAVLGLAGAIAGGLSALLSKKNKAIPFGPYLALAAVLVLLFRGPILDATLPLLESMSVLLSPPSRS